MNASEFAAEVLDCELLPFQKEFMDLAYGAAKEHKQVIYHPPRGNHKISLMYLQALAIIMAAQDEGLISKEIIRNG